jgi:hypothetical protein
VNGLAGFSLRSATTEFDEYTIPSRPSPSSNHSTINDQPTGIRPINPSGIAAFTLLNIDDDAT